MFNNLFQFNNRSTFLDFSEILIHLLSSLLSNYNVNKHKNQQKSCVLLFKDSDILNIGCECLKEQADSVHLKTS